MEINKINKISAIRGEIKKAIIGKDYIIEEVLCTLIAGGHILLDDIPGVGKTTLALAFSKALDLKFNRLQFTPDVVPSDITGFSVYNREKNTFEYKEGAAMCNILLADEINRTSSKTQSALLEVMQEGKITVDGNTYEVGSPFIVIATQNPIETAGTQMLPEAQLDRFMVQLSIGYPDEEAQVKLLKDRQERDPIESLSKVADSHDILHLRQEVTKVHIHDKLYRYITKLTEATRNNEYIRLGVSPRGALALCKLAQAKAYIAGRDYVIPEDIKDTFLPVTRHRVLLTSKAYIENLQPEDVLKTLLTQVEEPKGLLETGYADAK